MKIVNKYIKLDNFIYSTKYIIEPVDFSAHIFDNINHTDLQELTYIPTISTLLVSDQYTIDFDKSQFIFSQDLIGKYIRIQYKTTGTENPFFITNNFYTLLNSLANKKIYSILSGIYFYKYEFDENHIWRLSNGDFKYNGNFYVCNELVFDMTTLSPPLQEGYYKCYYFFINNEIIENYLYNQTNTLTNIGILYSYLHENFENAKNEVVEKYKTTYNSIPLDIAYMWVHNNTTYGIYEYWIEYNPDVRGNS